MFECIKCGDKFKTRQGLRGHEQFKHSNFVKVRMKNRKADRILIDDKVVRIDELAIDLDSAVKLKKHAMEREETSEEVIDHLIKVDKQTDDFTYTRCIHCGLHFWMPSREALDDGTAYCVWCEGSQVWSR